MSKKLILFPFGGNAREACGMILSNKALCKEWDVVGLMDDNAKTHGQKLGSVKVLGGKDILKKFKDAKVLAVAGNPQNFFKRQEIIAALNISELRFASVIHPSCVISKNASVGFNSLLMPNIVLGVNASVGNHCVLLPNTTIGHDTTIDDYCCIGSNVSISGGVKIQNHCYIGSGANIKEDITIGQKTLVGLGSNVINNLEGSVVAVGNPARRIKA